MSFGGVPDSPQGDRPILAFDHVHILALDMDGMADWLRDKLDGRIVGQMRPPDRPRTDVDLGGLKVFVSPRKADAGSLGHPSASLDHLAFVVDDVDSRIFDLVAKGVQLVEGPSMTRPGLRTAFILGPEGLRIELLHREAAASDR